MEFYSKRLVGFFLLACSFSSAALAESANDVLATDIVAKLKSARSELNYRFVGPSVIPSLYEVQVEGGPMLYVTEDGSFFFDGNLYKVKIG